MTESAAPFQAEAPAPKPMPANTWIVSGYKFRHHRSLKVAEDERDRLAEKEPHRTFTVYRVKSTLEPSDAAEKITLLEDAIRRLGSSEAFTLSRTIDPDRDAELLARIDFARSIVPQR